MRLVGRHLLGATVAVTLLLAAGCGGSADTYDLTATRHCLRDAPGVEILSNDGIDLVLENAPQGAIHASVGSNEVGLGFGRSGQDAARMRAGYKVFADAFETPMDDIVFVNGNVLISWDSTPSDDERENVEDCLS